MLAAVAAVATARTEVQTAQQAEAVAAGGVPRNSAYSDPKYWAATFDATSKTWRACALASVPRSGFCLFIDAKTGKVTRRSGRHWVSVPHQGGVRVDLDSIQHGNFPTGGYSSPRADTRAFVDDHGEATTHPFWCSGQKMTFGEMHYGTLGPGGAVELGTYSYDWNKVQDFVCGH